MLRFLLRALLVIVFAVVLVGVTGPLFIDPNPEPESPPSKIDPAQATHEFVTVPVTGTPGLRLHYRDSADPEDHVMDSPSQLCFVLLHGFTFNLSTWDRLYPFFSREGRTLAYDQVPYGLSEKPLPDDLDLPNPYSKASAIEQLLAFMDTMEIKQAVLVGNSSGGTLALELALKAPERVRALILIDPWIYANRPTFPHWVVDTPQMRRISLMLARHLGDNMPLLDFSYANPEFITEERRELAADHRWTPGWDISWGALMNRSLLDPVTVSKHLAKIQQPTLILAGSDDRLVKVTDSARAANTLPNAELAVLPDCGHVPQEECPDLAKAVIANWLRQL